MLALLHYLKINIFVLYSLLIPQSVLVVKDLGVQYTRSGAFGLQTSQFIEQHRIVDVLINEVITMVLLLLIINFLLI